MQTEKMMRAPASRDHPHGPLPGITAVSAMLFVLLALVFPSSGFAAGTVLLGSQNIASTLDSNQPGEAEAFQFTATTSGTLGSLTVYLDSSSSATQLVAGLYANSGQNPGVLLSQGSSTALMAGAWNSMAIPPVSVTAGTVYWIAILGTGGTLKYRDSGANCVSQTSAQVTLTMLPATWTVGSRWFSCTLSAYGSASTSSPVLTISQSTLSFMGTQGSGTNPVASTVNVTNTGGGSLPFTASSDSSWLSVTPGSGTAPQTLQISATLGTLAAASYSGHVTVTAAGVQGSPATITVTFNVAAPAPAPSLSVSPTTQSFAATQGSSTNPATSTVSVTNIGGGNLPFTASSDSSWLSVIPSNGTAPQTLQISATLGILTAATYTGHVTVTAAGAQGSPATITVTLNVTPADVAPVISGVGVSSITSSGAVINWTTDKASSSQVNYGTTMAYGSSSPANSTLVTSHSVTLSGLAASTLYHYQVQSADSAGSLGGSADSTFTTSSAPSSCPCSIWSSTATPATAAFNDSSAVELGVKFTSDVSGYITGIRFYKGSQNTGTHTGSLWTSTGSLLASATFSGESPSGWQQVNFSSSVAIAANTRYVASYHTPIGFYSANGQFFATSSVDKQPLHALADGASSGNGVYVYGAGGVFPNSTYNATNYWVDVVFSTTQVVLPPPPDTTPPTVPTNLTATAASATQINLSWTASTDNVGVTGYKVERCSGAACSNFAQIATPTTTTLNDTGLTASTSYSYRVRATDTANNLSTFSSTATTSTTAAPDTMPPTAPTNLTATAASSSQINLSWTASTDNVGVTGYRVERCSGAGCSNFAQIATPASTTFNDTGLTASTSYSYRVRATDAAANLGAFSSTATASTMASPDITPPNAPSNLNATAASATQINLSWTASTDNVGVTGYRIERCLGAGCSNFAQIATPTTITFNDTGLTASTSYSYRVRATDAASNLSGFSSVASASTMGSSVSVSITPKRGGLTISQSLNFTATVMNDIGNAGVTWTASAGSFSAQTNLNASFIAPSTAGVVSVTATSIADITKSASTIIGVTDLSGVTTYHNNLARDGANTQEFALTTSNVATASFAKLFSCNVDAAIYAQPLWIANLAIGGGTHNVIFAATSRNTVYAFDADSSPCMTYWSKSLLPAGETWVSSNDVGTGDLEPEVGIVGTPVIDLPSKTLYVVSKSKNNGTNCTPSSSCHQRLHALSLIDGSEKFAGPVDITSAITVPGTGDGSSGGTVPFNTLREHQRPGLALVNGVVYVAWASHGDNNPYHGWVIGYDKATLTRLTVYNDSPNADRAGIWMGGGAPAADSSNNLYMITGNGVFDGNSSTAPNNDFGDSILKLGTSGGLSLSSWFTPSNESTLNGGDTDLGSGGATVLVDSPASPKPRLLIGGGKEGKLYLLDRDALGNFGDSNAWQIFSIGNGIFATPAFWQNGIYIAGVGGRLKTFQFNTVTGKFNASQISQSATSFGFPGSTPSISANGASNGIVWALNNNQYCTQQSSACGPTVLHAYDATNLATELWNSSQVAADKAGNAVKFTVPTVANGKVYVGTRGNDSTNGGIGELDVYALKPN